MDANPRAKLAGYKPTPDFANLPPDLTQTLAVHLTEVPFAPNRRLILEDTPPDALYHSPQRPVRELSHSPHQRRQSHHPLDPGEIIHLPELLIDTATTLKPLYHSQNAPSGKLGKKKPFNSP